MIDFQLIFQRAKRKKSSLVVGPPSVPGAQVLNKLQLSIQVQCSRGGVLAATQKCRICMRAHRLGRRFGRWLGRRLGRTFVFLRNNLFLMENIEFRVEILEETIGFH